MAMAMFKNANCQAASFSLNTLGWILSMTCMGLAEWRVWYMESSSAPSRGLACIGMWKVCTYQHNSLPGRVIACHHYSYSDTYLPLDIRIAQNLLLAASLLGLLGKVLMVTGLLRVYAGQLRKDTACNLFFASGVLSVVAGAFIFTAVTWNHHSVMNEKGIRFPPSFQIPFRPDRQEMGSTVPVAALAAFLMLLSGLLTISFQLPPNIHVYPEVSSPGNMAMAMFENANCQAASFIFNILGWMFSMIGMGLANWRVWYMESSSAPSGGLACIGMWKLCIYQSANFHSRKIECHRYTYSDTYLPLDIRIAQNLLLAASLLGLLGKVLTVMGLRRVYAGQLQKDTTCNLFFASGVLSVVAGAFILIAVTWNHHSVMNEKGIHFPPSFHIPFRPDRQEVGSAVPLAILAAFLMLLSGLLTISFQLPLNNHVYPEVSQVQPWGTPLLLKTLALFLAYVSWAFSMGIANSRSWRVWEFNSQSIAVMYIGLWETYYVETFNMTGLNLNVSVSAKLNASWGIPDEIYYGQDLLLLANFLAPVALVFSTLAVWASWSRAPYPLFFRSCYNTAALHLFLSCFCLTLTVAWNFIVDLYGQTTLEFPPKFPVSKEMIYSKRISYVLPLGVLACVFSLVGAIIFVMDSCAMEEEEEETTLLMPMV